MEQSQIALEHLHWNSHLTHWDSYDGTVTMEQLRWNSDDGTVTMEQFAHTLEQSRWNSYTGTVYECVGTVTL